MRKSSCALLETMPQARYDISPSRLTLGTRAFICGSLTAEAPAEERAGMAHVLPAAIAATLEPALAKACFPG